MEPSPSAVNWGYGTNYMTVSYRGHRGHNPTVGVGMLDHQPEQPHVSAGELSTQYCLPQGPAVEADRTFDIFSWDLLEFVGLFGLTPIEELSALVAEEEWEVVLNGPEQT
jgi:hypothetical protein